MTNNYPQSPHWSPCSYRSSLSIFFYILSHLIFFLSSTITWFQVSGQQFQWRPDHPLHSSLHQLLLKALTHFRTAWENPSSGSVTRAALTRCPQQPQLGSLDEEEQNHFPPHSCFKAEPSYPEKEIHLFLRDLKWTIHPFLRASWPQNSLSASNDPRTSWRSQFD